MSDRQKLENLYRLKSRSPRHEHARIQRQIDNLEEKLNGRDRQAPQALHGSSAGSVPKLSRGTLTLAQYAAQLFPGGPWPVIAEPYPAPEEAGIRAGEITAWRVWRVQDDKLMSTYKDEIWTPVMRAHADPALERYAYGNSLHIGIFAWKNLTVAYEHARALAMSPFKELPCAFGQVLLWGSVVEHEHGYRAEFAKVHKIMDGLGLVDLEALQKAYGVPGI